MSNDGAVTQMICGFFEFRNPAIFPLLETLPPVILMSPESPAANSPVATLIDMMRAELAGGRAGSYAAIDQLAFLLFVEVLREQVELGAVSDGLLAALFDPRIGRALTEIHQKPAEPWNLETLAQKSAMSRSGFAERFAQLVGLSPMKYLTSWRMTEARRLLRTTNLSTAQVAEMSGYESEPAFRKAFKNTLGETPGAVRAASQAQ